MPIHRQWRTLISLAAPVVVSKLSFTFMGLVDTAMVGRLGASEQAAVGIATTFMFTVYLFGLGVVGAVNSFVSQNYGARRFDRCGQALGQGLRLAFIAWALTSMVLILSRPFWGVVGLSQDVALEGFDYMLFRLIGSFGVFGFWAYNGYLEGLGHTRLPMWITLVANLVNAALDWVLIFGYGPVPALGVIGAGVATGLSNLFMFVCFVYVVHRPGGIYKKFGSANVFGRIDWTMMKSMTKVGLPMGAQSFLEVGAFLVFAVFIGWLGDAQLAANQVAIRLLSISFMTAWGVSTAAATLVGKAQGEGRQDLATSAAMRAVVLMLIVSAAIAVLFVSAPRVLARLFTPEAEVIELTVSVLGIAAVLQVFEGVSVVAYGALRGAGDTRAPMILVAGLQWIIGVPLVYLFTIHLGWGLRGAWAAEALQFALQGTLMFIRLKGGKWSEVRLVSSD